MSLSNSRIEPTVAVSDMAKAKEFYEGKLGLSGGDDQDDGGHTYPCGEGSKVHVYPSPDNAGKSTATLAAWVVNDFDGTVDELIGNGVTFEQYDLESIKTDEKGIAQLGDIKVAWFKDPDGNILAIGTE